MKRTYVEGVIIVYPVMFLGIVYVLLWFMALYWLVNKCQGVEDA